MSTSKPQPREPLNSRQRAILTTFYERNPYPSATERHQLAERTGRTLKQVQDWFSNRRRNDSKLVAGKTVSVSTIPTLPPPPTPTPIYYYPPVAPACPCCYFNPAIPTLEQPFYPPCSTFYYSPCDSFH